MFRLMTKPRIPFVLRWSALILAGLAMALTASVALPSPAHSEKLVTQVVVNGSNLIYDPPLPIVDDRMLVPLRDIFEKLGAEVAWDATTRTVTAKRGDRTMRLSIGSKTAQVNNRTVTLEVPALIIQDRTYVPLRFVAEALGARVDWKPYQTTISLTETPLDIATADPFVGTWDLPDTSSIKQIDIRLVGNQIEVHPWGACGPGLCDWGIITTPVSAITGGTIKLFQDHSFKTVDLILGLLPDGKLQLLMHTHYSANGVDVDEVEWLIKRAE